MSPVDPSACPAPRSLREQLGDVLGYLHCLNAAARRVELYVGDPNLDVKHEAREIQAWRLKAHHAIVSVNAVLASLPGDAAQDARPQDTWRGGAPMAQYAVLGIGPEAWVDLEEAERYAVRYKHSERSPVSIRYSTLKLVMTVLRAIRLQDFRAAQDAPQGWQPIATAPKDGSYLLALLDGWPHPVTVTWQTAELCWIECGRDSCRPTHWMPLPAPPVSEDTP
jgi:hypothetical protein